MTEDRTTPTTSDHPAGSARRGRLTSAAVGAGLGITAVVGLAVGASGLAAAQDDPGTTTEQTEAATVERGAHVADALAPLVEDGTLTQEQADAVVARLGEAWAERPRREHGPGPGAEAAAEALDLTTDELRDAVRGGSTLAELAEAQGVAIEDLADAMLAGMEERLAARVADGTITQEQADARLAEAAERITAHIEGEHGPRGDGPGRGERWGA